MTSNPFRLLVTAALLLLALPAQAQMPGRTITRDQFLEMMSQAAGGGAEAMQQQMESQRRQMLEQSMGKEEADRMFAEEKARQAKHAAAVDKVVSSCLGVSEATLARLSKQFEGRGVEMMAGAQEACKQKLPETIQMGPEVEALMEPFARCVFEKNYGAEAKKEGISYEKMQRCGTQVDSRRSLDERLAQAGSPAEKSALRALAAAEQAH